MNKQDIFNKVATHLLNQNKRSSMRTKAGAICCAYRGDDGTSCAVGCLISDKDYTADMEAHSVSPLFRDFPIIGAKLGHKDFLSKLQWIHDQAIIGEWRDKLIDLANTEGLTLPPCLQDDIAPQIEKIDMPIVLQVDRPKILALI